MTYFGAGYGLCPTYTSFQQPLDSPPVSLTACMVSSPSQLAWFLFPHSLHGFFSLTACTVSFDISLANVLEGKWYS